MPKRPRGKNPKQLELRLRGRRRTEADLPLDQRRRLEVLREKVKIETAYIDELRNQGKHNEIPDARQDLNTAEIALTKYMKEIGLTP